MSIVGGKTIVTHREFVADISGSVAFESTSYAINPGIPTVFPWLASIARNYESYRFRSLTFEYRTTSSSITPGSVMMALDYDASDSAPPDKCSLMSYAGATRSAPWDENIYRARPADLGKFAKERYTREVGTAIVDIKAYDVANLFIATQGMTAAAEIGELYVSYTVELQTPQLSPNPVISATSTIEGGTFADGWFLGTVPIIGDYDPLTVTVSTTSTLNDTVNFVGVAGSTYQISVWATGDTLLNVEMLAVGGMTIADEQHTVSAAATEYLYIGTTVADGGLASLRFATQGAPQTVTACTYTVTLLG